MCKTVAFDLHVHSCYSFDSFSTPADIVKKAVKKGLKGVAVTDHDTIRGGVEAFKYASAKYSNFIVIIGSEIKTLQGEILGLFLEKDIQSREPREVIKEIKEQGGIAVLPHPFKRGKLVQDNKLLSEFDAIEIFNARSFIKHNLNATRLCQDLDKAPLGGSDAHLLSEIGKGVTLIEDSVNDQDQLKEIILKKRTCVKGITCSPFAEVLSQWIKFFKTRDINVAISNIRRIYRIFFLLSARIIRGDYFLYWGKFNYMKKLEGNCYNEVL